MMFVLHKFSGSTKSGRISESLLQHEMMKRAITYAEQFMLAEPHHRSEMAPTEREYDVLVEVV
jgi:hypothetical protein